MSFNLFKLKSSPFLSNETNEDLAKFCSKFVPNEKLISNSDVLKNLKITPYIGPTTISTNLDAFINLDVRVDDIFVCGLLKSGSSWMQNIVWLLTHGLDYDTNQNVDLKKLTCNVDDFTLVRSVQEECGEYSFKDYSGNIESPRVFKTHRPVYFLPTGIWSKQAKIIYLVRNPKDSIVSEYHFLRNVFQVNFTIDDIVNGITNDTWVYTPRLSHILNFWRIRHLPNICFISYEDLVIDPFRTIKEVNKFLDCRCTDEQLKELVEYSSFDNMKKIDTINREKDIIWMEERIGKKRPDPEFKFLRKGKAGVYRDELNENQIKKLDDWIEQQLKDTDFTFKM